MSKVKHNAIASSMNHFDNEILLLNLGDFPESEMENVMPRMDRFIFSGGNSIIVLTSGRLLNLICAMSHPSFVTTYSFADYVFVS